MDGRKDGWIDTYLCDNSNSHSRGRKASKTKEIINLFMPGVTPFARTLGIYIREFREFDLANYGP